MPEQVIIDDADPLDGTKPMSCAEGRYGEVVVVQGHGVKPRRWDGSDEAFHAGITAPASAPTCNPITPAKYYVARCDVTESGACYNSAPTVTFATPGSPPSGFRAATAKAFLDGASVGEIVVDDGGKNYPAPPVVTLDGGHGAGAAIAVTMDGYLPPQDSITQVDVIDGPPFPGDSETTVETRAQWGTPGPIDIEPSASGSKSQTWWIYSEECDGPGGSLYEGWLLASGTVSWTTAGYTAGSGLDVRVGFYGYGFRTVRTDPCLVVWWGSWGVDGTYIKDGGSGYPEGSSFRITIPSANNPDLELILEARTPGHSGNTATPRAGIKSLSVSSAGSGFPVAPELRFVSESGFGASAYTTITTAGAIDTVVLESGGGGFKTVPTVEVVTGGAEAFAVARPHLRGKYQCYYRYVDETSEENGGPIPSNLSPVTEVDTGAGAAGILWVFSKNAEDAERPTKIELWRTTGDQAVALYRVTTINSVVGATGTHIDDLTDEELRDPDRNGYSAMPIVLPNGELNANRFVPPPDDKSVVVRFQDRFWYGVDTSGDEPNSIYFSEVDEPESVPDINEFVLQQNTRDSDVLTAMAPFGPMLLLMQKRHLYTLTYSQKPLTDANVSLAVYRGCLNQRCWDTHAGICYAMDQEGVYSISQGGEVSDISAAIGDIFRSQVDYSMSSAFFVAVDPLTRTLRAFVTLKSDVNSAEQMDPLASRALCYSIDTNTWWVEKYPQQLRGAISTSLDGGEYRSVVAGDSGIMLLDSGHSDIARGSVFYVAVTGPGSGYRTPPSVTLEGGGAGAEFASCINSEGQVTGIWILSPGYGYTGAELTIGPPDDPDAVGLQATAFATCTPIDADTSYFTPYRIRTGNAAIPNDSQAEGAGSSSPRDVSLLYQPQASSCDVALRMFYNNNPHARRNIVSRDRGVGFRQSFGDSCSRLDMGAMTTRTGYDTGVAKGVFSGRSIDDIQSSDRHVAVELVGANVAGAPVRFYELEVYGTQGEQ